MNNNCWLIGAGYMAEEYVKVLKDLNTDFIVIGKGEANVTNLINKYGIKGFSGGVSSFLNTTSSVPEFAIIAVSCEELYHTTQLLLSLGIRNILVEKPAGLKLDEISHLTQRAIESNINLYVAYNRRFYHSMDLLRNRIEEEGGIQSVQFEFTEWVHSIDTNKFPSSVLSRFVIANSSHVIDSVFFLAGKPKEFNFLVARNDVDWHPTGSLFTGSGITEKGVHFAYSSNWGAPGRWGIEVLTSTSRYYLKPLERLSRQEKGSICIQEIESDYQIDMDYKPGVYNMVNAFLGRKSNPSLCHISDHESNFRFYELIGNY
ncbi:Gfo/Idh/MocA family oxidoreductase [Aquirufa antheringensis]